MRKTLLMVGVLLVIISSLTSCYVENSYKNGNEYWEHRHDRRFNRHFGSDYDKNYYRR